ncbi:MAG: glycosyltransferase family 2 protein [Stellaceae bacterium]
MIAVVIPCYRVSGEILEVLAAIGPDIGSIYCVDDACPEGSGDIIEARNRDPRVKVLRHESNRGVGGAMVTGYRAALAGGAEIIVKMDGDGQMDPQLITALVGPILRGQADFTKGNRFFSVETVCRMPVVRLLGNSALSFMTKLSTGYWSVFDPTNGFTAIHHAVLRQIPLERLARNFFFESDMLFRLSIIRAVVEDVPMPAIYGEERSNLKIAKVIGPFACGHARNFLKRIFYNYFLRDFHAASVELMIALVAIAYGGYSGISAWIAHARVGTATPAGTVMLAALPIIIGVQLLLGFLNFDIQAQPRRPLQAKLARLDGEIGMFGREPPGSSVSSP